MLPHIDYHTGHMYSIARLCMQMVAYRGEQVIASVARHCSYLLSLPSTKKQTIVERMNPMMIGDIAGLLWQDAIKRDHQLDGDIWMGIYLIGNLKALPLYHLQLPHLIALKFVKGIGVLDIEG